MTHGNQRTRTERDAGTEEESVEVKGGGEGVEAGAG